MKVLRVDIENEKIAFENIEEEWKSIGGSAFIAKIMNKEVPPVADPLGPDNLFIIAVGPLAGTQAPQLGRISVGAKSPLTLGIKEANSGGPAAQILDRLGLRAVIVQGAPRNRRLYCLFISNDKTTLIPANEYRGMKNYELGGKLRKQYGEKVGLADPEEFRKIVKSWVDTLKHDISCSLYSRFGTPFAISNSASQGTLPSNNYRSGRPANFIAVSGNSIQKILFERGGKMHGCMPGCVVQCSIIYPDKDGKRLCAAYEYETIAMLGTNLGITDNDAIARLKFMCDDLGVDAIETGSSLGVAGAGGKR